jgi:DNA invertase Pin-like site-specific DNA recombinase
VRFILYARASTKDKQHPDHQLAELRGEAARRGWEVVGEIVELESGRKDDRPLWTAALDRVLRGEADGVAAVELSRFARSTRHLLDVSAALKAAGRHLVATRQKIDTTDAMGRLVFTFLAAIAEFESELTRERVSAGVRHARAKRGGKWGRGREVLSDQALSMAARLRGDGFSWRDVSTWLHGAGLSQPARYRAGVEVRPARPWPIGTLRDALARVELPPQK